VYDADLGGDAATSVGGSGSGGTMLDGGAGGAGAGASGSGGANADSSGGAGSASGRGGSVDGSAGGGGSSGAGSGGAGSDGGAGVGGAGAGPGGGGGADGGGSGGGAGATGSGGNAGIGGAGTSGTGGVDAAGGAAGTGAATGTGASAGTAGTGGTSGTGGTGGGAGSSGKGGSSGSAGATVDAGPDLPPPPGAVFAVGSFTKATATGTQTVTHTLGQAPKALILWTVGKTNETLSAGFLHGMGVSDSAESYAVGISTQDNVASSVTSRRMAPKAITLVQAGEVLIAEADLTSRTASNFALNWTTNDNQPLVIHYLAIGGPQVAAKVVMWTSPTTTGNKAITGIGFRPETVLHFYGGAALTASPSSSFNGIFGMGAMDKNGNQWASQVSDWDANNPSMATRGQQTDAAIYMYADGSQSAVTKEASFATMDSDGFTLNFKAANSNAGLICSLALSGVRATVGSFNKVTGGAPASQGIASVGFKPGAVLLSSYQMGPQSASISEPTCSYGMGASDGTHQGSSAFVSTNNNSPTSVDGVDKTSKVFVKMNTAPEDAEADLTSFDPTGFTLNWTMNDNVGSQIGFWALAAP